MSCSDPAALLKDGECVPDCGAGFYSQEGVCYGKVDTFIHIQYFIVSALHYDLFSASVGTLIGLSDS